MPFPVMQNASDGKPVFDPKVRIALGPFLNELCKSQFEVNVRRDESGCDSVYEGSHMGPR
jgi:hypothetical protein